VADQLIGDVLTAAASLSPNKPAVSLGDKTLTYEQLAARADELASALLASGVALGDRVAWQAPTSIDAVALYFASAMVGAIFTPLNPRATAHETDVLLAKADPALTLGDGSGKHRSLASLAAEARVLPEPRRPRVRPDDGQAIFFTSGTSGAPKGCVLSHRAQLMRSGFGAPWPAGDTVCMFPQFHMANWLKSLEAWMGGTHVILVEQADAEHLIDAIEQHRAAKLYCIPAVWERILEADRAKRDLSSMRYVETGTSKTSERFLLDLSHAFPHAQISVVYGSTEAGVVCLLRPEDLHSKPGSVGPAFQENEIRLDDGGGMLVRNPWMFSGYFRDPEATAAASPSGWYRTGDLAERDSEGYFQIVGRVGDLVRTGGETVAPSEVEGVIQSHPAVAEVAVAGLPDERWGEVVTAFIVLRAGASLTLDDLRGHCSATLAAFKQPRKMVVVDALPRTSATGQIQRKALLGRFAEEAVAPASQAARQC
jgi:acyl-CoA synthetase (AMP-forming)/AMP-acid ligase II